MIFFVEMEQENRPKGFFTVLSFNVPKNSLKYCYKMKQQQQILMTFCAGNLISAAKPTELAS